MDLDRMRDKCVRGQWSIDDLDWSLPPPTLPPAKEEAVVQAFVDMAGIERLAGALFAVQRDKTGDPILRDIFASFVVDEERHSEVAARLARHYDVRHLRRYEESAALRRFRPHFLDLVRDSSPEIANAYITAGELILDIALLRSIDDYVGDEMSHQAMELINRDESRHIAIDFHMTEFYTSDAHLAELERRPSQPWRVRARMLSGLAKMMWHAKPFFQEVFLRPMDAMDPGGRRLREALKRIQLVLRKPTVARAPFTKLMIAVQDLYNHPRLGPLLGPALLRVLGADDRAARRLFTEGELARSQAMTFEQLAEEALAAKLD
ncbi:MAG: hypothetical protein KBG28_13315 [Kofleriaceae bacterium]|nr:hypothetical protein [Kofleriaceae bacterium]MBP9204944.1 hypothetical protein [Kofleriaceae bacterium]